MTSTQKILQLQDELLLRDQRENALLAQLAAQSEQIKKLTDELRELRRLIFGQKREKSGKMPSPGKEAAQANQRASGTTGEKAPGKPRKKRERHTRRECP